MAGQGIINALEAALDENNRLYQEALDWFNDQRDIDKARLQPLKNEIHARYMAVVNGLQAAMAR